MQEIHTELLRALIAAQCAVIEHADEDFSIEGAKTALLTCLAQATKLAKQLEN